MSERTVTSRKNRNNQSSVVDSVMRLANSIIESMTIKTPKTSKIQKSRSAFKPLAPKSKKIIKASPTSAFKPVTKKN